MQADRSLNTSLQRKQKAKINCRKKQQKPISQIQDHIQEKKSLTEKTNIPANLTIIFTKEFI